MARVDRRAFAVGRIAVLYMVLAGVGFGCAPSRGSPFVGQDETTIHVQIDNRAFENATVHAIWPGRRLRLGTVIGHTTAAYRLELGSSVLLRFEIDLLAGPKCTTEQIWADPGDVILLEIDPRFLGSAVCLR